jgi:hypothetical protein
MGAGICVHHDKPPPLLNPLPKACARGFAAAVTHHPCIIFLALWQFKILVRGALQMIGKKTNKLIVKDERMQA